MKSNFPFKFKVTLWLVIFLFSLLCQGQNAKAQFGLFDTVWTTNTFAPTNSTFMTMSSNDSLVFLFKKNEYGVPDDTSQKFILFRTLDLNDTVWYMNNYPERNLPLKFIENDSKIIFQCRTQLSQSQYINPCIKTRDAGNFQVVDSVAFDYWTFPPNTGNCYKFNCGVSEIDTSVYYWGYCGVTAIKGISYKVNYKTGQTTITSDSLQYFAMTISEDGQYVAGVYYTGGTASNVPYNEVIEVRKISDYSIVFQESRYYCDYTSNFYPYSWVTDYKFKFSKDNKFLAIYKDINFNIINLYLGQLSYNTPTGSLNSAFSEENILFYLRSIPNEDNSINYKVCTYDCNNEIYFERDFLDSTNQIIFRPDYLVLNDNYILCHTINQYNKQQIIIQVLLM